MNKKQKNHKFYFNLSTADQIGVGFFKYAITPQPKFIIVNNAFAQIIGCRDKAAVERKNFFSLFKSEAERRKFLKVLKRTGKVRFFETSLHKGKRAKVWVAITALYVKHGSYQYIEGIMEDITAHRKTEEKLALEKEYMQNLLEAIPDAIYFKDRKNRIVKVNQFYAKGVGLPVKDIIGKTDFDFFPHHQAKAMFADDTSVVKSGKPIIGKVERTLLRDGSWNQVMTTKIPMRDKRGKIIGTMGITRDMTAYANLENDRLAMVVNGLNVLVKAIEMRDPYTFTHTRNVAIIAEKIAQTLGWDKDRLFGVRLAAELHDLGKMSIPMDILNKPGKLSTLEYRFIQNHVVNCYDLMKDIEFPFPLAETIYQHHERLDGSGYPNKLGGGDILIEAKILAVSDVLEAMTHHRPYRAALGLKKAKQEIKQGAGKRYDAEVVKIACSLIKQNNDQPFWQSTQIVPIRKGDKKP
jgi:PAS domain S-box-containing protein/putative nucleotidyltransferase with HDIG domain